ncbi:ABC transporter substrate-binding protein [Cognatishimia sp. SS12]|uniref:ABC transporter substrate-binding protein n=1 Tax=Cognatishimia sp. SS12 TaxID=2979465 RepID=UPI002330E570|nr:ABC transporter substrate-binding protein [Cognatishimia sp. SS12]MDC0737645.1 ABC transporter substrate-binding protein [Cognatishimia sp. SS12]
MKKMMTVLAPSIALVAGFVSTIAVSALPAAAEQAQVVMLTWRGDTPAEQGFRQGLSDAGVDAAITSFDANRDRTALAGYIRDNLDQLTKADVVYTFGTTTSQVLHTAGGGQTKHVFNIVSDPVAAGIVNSLDQPGGWVTGTTHVVPLDVAFDLINKVKPFQTIGFLFDPNEENTVVQMRTATRVLEGMGKTIKPIRIVPEEGILSQQEDRLDQELEGLDLLYVPSASSLIANADAVFEALPKDIFIVGAVGRYVEAGAAIALGPDYFERGIATARSAIQILNGADPGAIPVNRVNMDGVNLVVKDGSADQYGLDFSQVPVSITALP